MDGALTTVSGKGGNGKSWLMLAATDAVATGRDLAGIACKQGPAIYIDGEMGRDQCLDRIRGARIGGGCVLYDATGLDLSQAADQQWLRAIVEEHIDPEVGGLVGIDSLRRLTASRRENDSDDMAPVMSFLAILARQTGAGILLLHHEGHQGGRARGSSAIVDQSDAMFSLAKLPKDKDPSGTIRRLTCRGEGGKMRMGPEPEDIYFVIAENGGIEAVGAPDSNPKKSEYKRAIPLVLPKKTKKAAAEACETTADNTVWQAAWSELEAAGTLAKDAAGQWTANGEPAI